MAATVCGCHGVTALHDWVVGLSHCGSRWIKATVNGVDGTILLPDDRDASTYDLNDTNGGNYSSNTITAADWTNTLEANGAVFLPAVGHRMGDSFFDVGYGFYWSSSYYNSSEVCLLEINALVSKISNL
ncbi:MAG: hypothetical protein K6G25_08825 [Bacteroidales bacterium]|nr:hypothetical protein [Bacteroidales bacterium]